MSIMTAAAPTRPLIASDDLMEDEVSVFSRTELDILLLNIETAVKVAKRSEFFSWVQGVFQGVIAHEVLICGLAFPGMGGLRFEWLGSYPLAAERFAELCSTDGGLMYRAIGLWHERGGAPLVLDPLCGETRSAAVMDIFDLLRRWELANLVAHGLPGLDGRPAGFFALCRLHGPPAQREARMMRMLLPYLYSSWLRANCERGAESLHREQVPILTQREIEILEWMQKGKSNSEIADILSISQLTVKNHVQKILRKLGANNRTQAVAKGISMSITRGGAAHLY
jgi:transcriptional regulator EpsA